MLEFTFPGDVVIYQKDGGRGEERGWRAGGL